MKSESIRPEDGLRRLLEGNARFISAEPRAGISPESLERLGREGQRPWAVVVACSDSRVPPELVFDCGLGDLFVVRTAGHVLASSDLGSVEYAVHHLGVRLILILGHTGCGAVAAALSGAREPGALGALLDCLASAVAVAGGGAQRAALAENANIRATAALLRDDPLLGSVEGLSVYCAKYDTCTGVAALLEKRGASVEM